MDRPTGFLDRTPGPGLRPAGEPPPQLADRDRGQQEAGDKTSVLDPTSQSKSIRIAATLGDLFADFSPVRRRVSS